MSYLAKGINDELPDVRKSVVFCIVDLYSIFQSEMDELLGEYFTPSQRNLVAIYIQRREQQRKQVY